jgi:hypothetical protein
MDFFETRRRTATQMDALLTANAWYLEKHDVHRSESDNAHLADLR